MHCDKWTASYLFNPPLCKRGVGGGFYKNSAQHGFTLVEIVLTLVILGILASVAGPRFFDLSAFNERGFYDEVLSAVRYAQKYAISSGCEVQFSVITNTYTLNQRNTNCTTGTFTLPVYNPGTHQPGFTGNAPSGVTLSMNPVSTIVFNAQGFIPAQSNASVTISTGGRTITVIGGSGFAKTP